MLKHILYGGRPKRRPPVQGDKTDKTRPTTNQGYRCLDEDPVAVDTWSLTDTNQQPWTERECHQIVRDPQRHEELSAIPHRLPQTSTGQRALTKERSWTIQRDPKRSEEPPAMPHSLPQTSTEQRTLTRECSQTFQGDPKRDEEPPVMPHPHPQVTARQQTVTREYSQIAGDQQRDEEPPVMPHPPPQVAARQQTVTREYSQIAGDQQRDEEPPVMPHPPPRAAARQRTATREYSQIAGDQQRDEEPPVMPQPPPQAAARQRTATREYSQIAGDPQRNEEPPVTPRRSPQTSAEQRAPTRERSQIARDPHEDKEPPVISDPPPQIGAEQHPLVSNNQQGPSQASEEIATVRIEDLEIDDIVIAVMGPTGSGKSTLVRVASGLDTQGVGHTLRSFTSEVIAHRFLDQESSRHVVLVDTPGFDDTIKSDLDILNMISDWLNGSYKKQKLLSGILYLHRITDNRMAGTPLKNLRVFRKLCGKDALDKVCLVTTMWDEVDSMVGRRRLEELKQEYWKTMIAQGAQTACCRNDDDSPKKIIQRVLDQEAVRKTLLLQEEISVLEKELKETEAGQELYSQLEKLIERQVTLLQKIGRERRTATEPSVLAELQTEYNELRMQIDDRLRQMQELKLSRWKSFLRFVSRRRE